MTDDASAAFTAQRPRLFGLAYRLLGSATDAEDVLQDAFLRWNAADRSAVREPAAWLTRTVTNLCLTELTSARARRERYTGPWLPEPVLSDDLGPLETVAQRESVSMGMLLLQEQLSPAERAVFILHEAFGYPYKEIGTLLDRSEASCRQLGHRAAAHLKAASRAVPSDAAEAGRWRRLTDRFLAAASSGDLAGLEKLLAEDAVSFGDGGGNVPAGMRPVYGRAKVARLFAGLGGILRPGADVPAAFARVLGDAAVTVSLAEVNGSPAVLLWAGERLFGVFIPASDGEQITAVYGVVNPDKLTVLARQVSRPA